MATRRQLAAEAPEPAEDLFSAAGHAKPEVGDAWHGKPPARPSPTQPTLADCMPPRSPRWERMVEAAGNPPITVFASSTWHGTIVETLCDASGTQWALGRDGTVTALAAGTRPGRILFVPWEEARALSRKCRLAQSGPRGTVACRYRAAGPDDVACCEADMKDCPPEGE